MVVNYYRLEVHFLQVTIAAGGVTSGAIVELGAPKIASDREGEVKAAHPEIRSPKPDLAMISLNEPEFWRSCYEDSSML